MHIFNKIIFTILITSFTFTAYAESTDIEELTKKALAGDVNAQFRLAMQYDFGSQVERDLSEAIIWYRKAAEQGHADAQNSLGSLYQAGEGVEKNFTIAFEWYSKSAAQGHAEANNNLAYMYDLGLGVPEDDTKAMEHYEKAAHKGSLRAMYNLGIEYGKRENYIEAYKWFDLARFFTQNSKNMKFKWQIRGYLDDLKSKMTRTQIKQAKTLAKKWYKMHVK